MNKMLLASILIFLLKMGFSTADSGLVLHYNFDTPPDPSHHITDQISGREAIVMGADHIPDGILHGAFKFDGTDDYILIGDLGTFETGTISFWIKPDVVENWRNPFSTDFAGWDDCIRFEVNSQGHLLAGALGLGSHVLTHSLAPERWTHVALTWDGHYVKGFINGDIQFSTPYPEPLSSVHSNIPGNASYWQTQSLYFRNVCIGNGYSHDPQRFWKGCVDEVKIYNRPLSYDEIFYTYKHVTDFSTLKPHIYQNFSTENMLASADSFAWGWHEDDTLSIDQNSGYTGYNGLSYTSAHIWNGVGIKSMTGGWDHNFEPIKNDRLRFWVRARPDSVSDNNMAIRFFDNGNYAQGYDIWTRKKAAYDTWTQFDVLFSELPEDFNWQHVNHIEFVNYHPGTYLFDDILVTRGDRAFQNFDDPHLMEAGSPWTWGNSIAKVTNEISHSGHNALKLSAFQSWTGVGFNCGYQSLVPGSTELSVWHINTMPQINDTLSFWVFLDESNLQDHGFGYSVEVQLFDHEQHPELFTSDSDPVKIVPDQKIIPGKWNRLTIPFKRLPDSLNLNDLNKIQILVSWPGTYYFDTFTIEGSNGSMPENKIALKDHRLEWDHVQGADLYRLEKKHTDDADWRPVFDHDGWKAIDPGMNYFTINEITDTQYRIRFKTLADKGLPYERNWSEPILYEPPLIHIYGDTLRSTGVIEWKPMHSADGYQVERSRTGNRETYETIYTGNHTSFEAAEDFWYRVRGIKDNIYSAYSHPVQAPSAGTPSHRHFLKTRDTCIVKPGKNRDIPILLRGVNLGSYLLIEPWMTGLGDVVQTGDNIYLPDDWSIRDTLQQRFGSKSDLDILKFFQDTFIQEYDFDSLSKLGINLIRLPLNYKIFHDDDGTVFHPMYHLDMIEKIVNQAGDRGMYVLLDLHGSPGFQNNEFHSGRQHQNKLFDPIHGETFREQTKNLWLKIASHFKDHPAIMGYDILNEPTGVYAYGDQLNIEPREFLWSVYNDLYQTIRSVDPHHIIVMEGVWGTNKQGQFEVDMATLPSPGLYHWKNVVYQFHWYASGEDGFLDAPSFSYDLNSMLNAHVDFLNDKISQVQSGQDRYHVPVMIGEFNAFEHRLSWEHMLNVLNHHQWHWTLWSYKVNTPFGKWGLFTRNTPFYKGLFTHDNGSDADFENDDLSDVLLPKLEEYDTLQNYIQDTPFVSLLKENLEMPAQATCKKKMPCVPTRYHSSNTLGKNEFKYYRSKVKHVT